MNRILAITALASIALAGCRDESGQAREQAQTQKNLNQASTIIGMPGIINFTEKRNLKMVYELRDQEGLVTYSYYVDINGKKHKICPTTSVGYPFPYSTQYTAPRAPRMTYPPYPSGETSGAAHLFDADQPEPNGLYMPGSAEASWVICLNPDGKTLSPVYVEDKIQTYPWPVPSAD